MASKFTITAELNLQTKNLSQVVNNLKQQFQGADLNIKIKDLAKAEASLRNISSGAKDASASMGTLGASISQGIRRFTVVTAVTGTIVGFTRALKNAVGDAIEFERELVKIAQATGQSVAQLRGLATEVGNVSSSFGVSSKELILAARSLTQAGFAADKVTGSLKILAQTELAATFDSISNTTEGAIALLNQFGKQAQKTGSEVAFLEKSFSAINQVSKEFAVESSDLVTAVRTTGAAFEAAGGNLNELLALFTSVRSTTRESAESISTGFRTIFTRIQRVDTINNLKALGIQLQDVEGKFVGPMEATKRLSMALSTIDPRDFRFNLIVEELGGFRQVSKVIPLIQQFATTQKALNVAQGSSGSLAKDAQTAQLSLAVQISKTREEFLRFIRDLTETESFQGTVRTLLNMANAFIKVADTIKPLIPLLGVFAGLRIGQSILPAIASVAGGRNRKAEGGVIHKFARGGLVPGEGNGDTVPAMLTPGEFVIKKSSVKKLGVDKLASANKYGKGGIIVGRDGPLQKSHVGKDVEFTSKDFEVALKTTQDAGFQRSYLARVQGVNTDKMNNEQVKDTFGKIQKFDTSKDAMEKMRISSRVPLKLNFPKSYNQALRVTDKDLVGKADLIDYVKTSDQLLDSLPKNLRGANIGSAIAKKLQSIKAHKPGSLQNENDKPAYDMDSEIADIYDTIIDELKTRDMDAVAKITHGRDIFYGESTYNPETERRRTSTGRIGISNLKIAGSPQEQKLSSGGFVKLYPAKPNPSRKSTYQGVEINENMWDASFDVADPKAYDYFVRSVQGPDSQKPILKKYAEKQGKTYEQLFNLLQTQNSQWFEDRVHDEIGGILAGGNNYYVDILDANKTVMGDVDVKDTKKRESSSEFAAKAYNHARWKFANKIGPDPKTLKELSISSVTTHPNDPIFKESLKQAVQNLTVNKPKAGTQEKLQALGLSTPTTTQLGQVIIGATFKDRATEYQGYPLANLTDKGEMPQTSAIATNKAAQNATGVLASVLYDKLIQKYKDQGDKTKINVGQAAPVSLLKDGNLSPIFNAILGTGPENKVGKNSFLTEQQVKAINDAFKARMGFASGGAAEGTDTVPAMLTPGEYVINKKSAQAIGYSNLNRMNKVGKFANGGEVQYLNKGGVAGNNNSEFSDIFSKYNDDELHHVFVKTALLSPNFSDSLTQYRELNLLPKPDSSQRGNSLKTMIEGYGLSKLSDKQLEAKYKNQFEITDDIKNAFKYYDRGIVDLISSFKKEDKNKIGEMANVDLKKDKNFGKIEVHTSKNAISARYIGDENDRTGFITAVKAKGDDDFYRTKFSYATSGYGLKLYETLLSEVAKAGSWMAPDNADISNEAANLWKRYYTRGDVDKNLLSYSNWNNKTGKFKTTPLKDIEQLKSTWPSKKDPDWALQYKYRKLAASADDANIVRSKRNFGPSYEGQEAVISAFYETPTRLAVGGNVPGDGNQDTVPAMLTPGEYVINKKSAQAIGYGALNRMNKIGKFANGGPVQFLNPGGGVKGAFGNTPNVTAQPFANFTATTANPYPKAPPSSQKIDVLSSALEQSAKTIGQGADKVTNKFGDVSDQLLLFGPAITGFISQMGMFDKATADMVSATTFTFSTIKGVGGNLTQQAGKLFGLKENSKLFTGLNAGVTGFAAAQAIAAGKAQYFGQTVEEQGKKFNSFVESLSKNDAVSADEMTNVLAQKFNAANKQQASNSGQRKLISGGVSLAAGGIATAMTGNPLIGQAAATAAGILTETFYALKDDLQEPSKEIKAQAEALAVAMRSAVTSNRNFQQFMQSIDKQSPTAIIQQANSLSEAYKTQTARLAQIKSQDLANASEAVKNDFNAVSEAVKQTTANFQALIGVLVQQSSKQAANLVRQGFMPDSNQLIQPALKAIEDKVNAEYQTKITEAQAKEKAGKAPVGTTALIGKQRDAQIASEQALAKKTLLESIQQNLEMAKSLAIENDLRRQLIGTMQKELGINAAIEQTAYNLNQVAKTVSNIDAVFSGSLTGLKSSYDTETLKMKNPNQENLEKALKPVRAVGPIGEELSNNILDINKVMPILEAKLLQFSNATDTASGGLLDVSKFVKTAFNIDPNGIVGKTLVNIIETTTRGTGGGTNSVTASSTSLREPEVRKKIAETFQKFGEGFKTQAGGILDLMNQTEQEGRVIAEKINESRQRQLELAIQGIDTFSQYIDAVSKARGRDMTLMQKNTIRNMRQYALAGSMGNNSAALGQRLNKIYADLNKGGLSTEQSANLALEAKQLTKALEGLANQSDKTADILQEIDKVKKNRENLRELGREFGTGTAEDKDKMQQDMAAAMTVAQTGTYDSIPEEMRKGADAMLERFKDIPAFKQAQNRAIADTFMKAGNPLAAQMVLQETSTPEEILIHQLDILFTQQIAAQKTLSLIEAQRQEFLKKAQEDNTTAMGELSNSITALVKHYQDEAAAKAILRTDDSITTLPPASATSAEAMGVVNPTGFKPLFPTFFNNNRPKPPVPGVFDATGTTGQLDINSVEGLNTALVAVNAQLAIENTNLNNANTNIAYFTGLLESSAFVIDGWTGALVNFFSAQPAEIRGGEAGAAMNQAGMGVQRASGGLIYRADGGSIFQPKGTDTVPAMLTPGEFVIKKSSVDKIGADTLSKINAGAYATGGLVSYLAEGGESIANGGAKVNNITLKRVYDQLQAIDKRVAFLEQEYKALSVLIASGALGGGQQMAEEGGGQQMAQQGGGQQQMANQPRGNGLRSVPPAREPIKLDDKGKPSPDGKRVLTPIPPEPNNNFRNDLYKDSDGKVVSQNGMPVADWEVKGWRLQANAQQQDDYKTLSKPMTSAGRRIAKKNMRERDLKHEDDIVQAVHSGNATAEQKLEYDERYKNKLNADRKKYGEKDADSIDHPHDGRKSYIERRTEAEQISANRRAEEKADPARFKRPSATATWDPVKRIWNDSVAQAEKATMDDPNALESRLLGLTGHKPIKPEDRPAAEAKLKALQDKKETTRVAGLTNEQIARETEAELNLAIKNKAPIAQVLSLNDKLEKARGAAQAEARNRDAERIKTSQAREAQSKLEEDKMKAGKASAETGPQMPIEIRDKRHKEELAAIEEKNKKEQEESANFLASLPSNKAKAEKASAETGPQIPIEIRQQREGQMQLEEEQRAKEERMASPEGLAVAAENERKHKELLEYNKKLKTYEENVKTVNDNPEVFTGARGNTLDLNKPMEPDFLRDRDKIDIKPNEGGAYGSAGPGAIPYNVAEANSEAISRQTPEYLANRSIMRDSTAGALEYGIGRGIMQPFDLANLGINVTARQFGVDAGLPTNMAQEAFPKPTEDASYLTHAAGRVAEAAGSMFTTGGAGSAATAALGIGSDVVTGVASEQLDLPPWASIGLGIAAGRATDVAVPKMQDAANSLAFQQWAFGDTPEVLKRKAQIAATQPMADHNALVNARNQQMAKAPQFQSLGESSKSTSSNPVTAPPTNVTPQTASVDQNPTTPLNTAQTNVTAQTATAPVTPTAVVPQPYQVDTTQVNTSQADAQTKAAVQAATAPVTSTAPVTETYVNPTAVTSKVETPPSKPRGVLGRLSNIFNLDNSEIPNKSTFRAGQPIDTAKATTIPTTSPANDILKAVKDNPTAPYDRSKAVTDLTDFNSPFYVRVTGSPVDKFNFANNSRFSRVSEESGRLRMKSRSMNFDPYSTNIPLSPQEVAENMLYQAQNSEKAFAKQAALDEKGFAKQAALNQNSSQLPLEKSSGPSKLELNDKFLQDNPAMVKFYQKFLQNKASGGLITYLANGGPFHGMPRSGGAFNNFGNAMAGSLNDTSNWMTKSYNDYAHAPAQAFSDTANWMTGSFNDAANGMTSSFNDAASGMTGSFNNMKDFMSGSFQGAGNWMTGSFNDAASGMTNSFNNFAASFEKGGLISYLARGGSPKGTDTVPAMLTPGEFVMQKEAVDKHGTDFMEKLNKGGEVPGFATGGLVGYFRNGGRSGSIAEARARQFNDPRNAGRLEHVARMQTAATGSSYIAQAGAAFAPQRYGNMGGGGGGQMEMQQGGGQMQVQQGGPAENKQQANGGGLKSVAPSPTGGDSGGAGAPNMSEVTTALNNMSTAFTGFTDKLNALATAFSGLTVTHNVVFGGQINIAGIDPTSFTNALTPWVNQKINTAIAALRGEGGQMGQGSPVAKPPGS